MFVFLNVPKKNGKNAICNALQSRDMMLETAIEEPKYSANSLGQMGQEY
jgi:hypothetical protein